MGIIEVIEKRKFKEHKKLVSDALEEANIIAKILVNKFGAKEVLLYGSLLNSDHFSNESDIDISVKGLENNYFKAYGYCLRKSKFNIDIKAYEDMPENFRKNIRKFGKIL